MNFYAHPVRIAELLYKKRVQLTNFNLLKQNQTSNDSYLEFHTFSLSEVYMKQAILTD